MSSGHDAVPVTASASIPPELASPPVIASSCGVAPDSTACSNGEAGGPASAVGRADGLLHPAHIIAARMGRSKAGRGIGCVTVAYAKPELQTCAVSGRDSARARRSLPLVRRTPRTRSFKAVGSIRLDTARQEPGGGFQGQSLTPRGPPTTLSCERDPRVPIRKSTRVRRVRGSFCAAAARRDAIVRAGTAPRRASRAPRARKTESELGALLPLKNCVDPHPSHGLLSPPTP